ncbi:hypothetical protein IWQ62_006141, partial [Dispira parvispora]
MQKSTKHLALLGILLSCSVSAALAKAEKPEAGLAYGNAAPQNSDQGNGAYPPAQPYPPKLPEQEQEQLPEPKPEPETEQPESPPVQPYPPKQSESQPEPQPEQPTYPTETPTEPEAVETPITTPGVSEPDMSSPVETPADDGNDVNAGEPPAGNESDTPTTLPAFVTQLLGMLDKIGDEGQEGTPEDQYLPTETNTEGAGGEPEGETSTAQPDDGNNGDSGIVARNLATDEEPEPELGQPTPTPSVHYTTEDIYTRVRIPLYRLSAFQQALRTISTTAHPEEETEPAVNEEEETSEEGQVRDERRPERNGNSHVRATFTITETRKTTTSEETTSTETSTSHTTTHKESTATETTSPTTTTAI